MSAHRRVLTGLSFVIVGIALAVEVDAHTRSQSFSSWWIRDGEVRMSFSVPAREVTRLPLTEGTLPDLDTLLLSHLATAIRVVSRGEPCISVTGARAFVAPTGHLRVESRFSCPADAPIQIWNDAFFPLAPSHIHYARVRSGDGPPAEYLFSNARRTHEIVPREHARSQGKGASLSTYVLLGIEHILNGVDHIAFLVSLLLLCGRLKEVIFMVTGFTLGHSITLGLATFGILEPDVPVIDALIGFTIALVAAENVGVRAAASRMIAVVAGLGLAALLVLRFRSGIGLPVMTSLGLLIFAVSYLSLSDTPAAAVRHRPALTVLFGLIHGFGFARVLMEIDLSRGRLASALFGFNLGVEIGQLGIVATLGVTAWLIGRSWPSTDQRLRTDLLSTVLCALGLYWFVARALAV